MPDFLQFALAACMFLAAAVYTSVGQAGASTYIALMALFGIAPTVIRPTALVLNVLAASFTSFRYLRAGLFRWRTLWPFLVGAIPFAVLGGSVQLPGAYYRPLVGAILLVSGARLLWPRELRSVIRATRRSGQASFGAFSSASCRASRARAAGFSSRLSFCSSDGPTPAWRRARWPCSS